VRPDVLPDTQPTCQSIEERPSGFQYHYRVSSLVNISSLVDFSLITFCVSRRRCKMYCGHARLCVCVCVYVSVRGRTPTLLHGPGCNLGAW